MNRFLDCGCCLKDDGTRVWCPTCANGGSSRAAGRQGTCTWTEDDNGAWEGACGVVWEFTDGGPGENDVRFCMRCGRPVSAERKKEVTDG